MAYNPVYKPFTTKPVSQVLKAKTNSDLAMLRDNFSIQTWVMIGAFFQGLLCLLPYRNIALVAPVATILAFQISRTLLMIFGVIRNPYMDDVVTGRTSILYANGDGAYEKPGDSQVCAIMLATRSNHPLGILGPGYKEVGDRFNAMIEELDNNATVNGYLGSSAWLSAADRGVSSESMSIVYFDSLESLHAFAHGPLHTETMEWWQRTADKHKHVAIMHEVFAAPKHGWEAVYLNYHPTGLGGTFKEATVDGKKAWLSPLVQAKGQLAYSKGRMGRPFGDKEWVAYEKTLTEEER